jgi:DNA adenine methylase
VKPLLKWAGGKRQIAPTLEKFLPSDWNAGTYFEPFLGGAALFLYLEPARARLADINPWLVRFYTDVKHHHILLMAEIQKIVDQFDALPLEQKKNYYLELRAEFNAAEESLRSSALFFALNKLCFNGLYRENSKGNFNVPFGQKKKFPEISVSDFAAVSKGFSGVEIDNSDFESTVAHAIAGDFVYFDPPYVPLADSPSFTSYSAEGFGYEAQKRLAATMHELKERGVKAMLSNSATPLTVEIYEGLRQETISAPRMVSAKAAGRGPIDELVILNY